jgi:hypothetical protein
MKIFKAVAWRIGSACCLVLLAHQHSTAAAAGETPVLTEDSWLGRYVARPAENATDMNIRASSTSEKLSLRDVNTLYDEAVHLRGSALNTIVAFIGVLPDSLASVGFEFWETHRGGSLQFLFKSFNNAPTRSFLIDFDDGIGKEHVVQEGSLVIISYPVAGVKSVRIRAAEELNQQSSVSLFRVSEALPSPSSSWFLSTLSPELRVISGYAYIFPATANGPLDRPLIITDAPLFSAVNPVDAVLLKLTSSGLFDKVQSAGWDIIILDLSNATAEIRTNAQLFTLLMERVKREKVGSAKTAVLGLVRWCEGCQDEAVLTHTSIEQSTSGLLARFSLAWMENQGISHDVALYMSLDTPHWGASLSLGNQYFLRFSSQLNAFTSRIYQTIISPTFRQTLLLHESVYPFLPIPTPSTFENIDYEDTKRIMNVLPDPLYTSFFNELRAIGDHPKQLRKVALANGNGFGTGQGFTGGQGMLHLESESYTVDRRYNTGAVGPDRLRTIFEAIVDFRNTYQILYYRETVQAIGPAYEFAPGGTLDVTRMIVQQAAISRLTSRLPATLSECFVPTLSAVDSQDRSDLFKGVSAVRTPFDAVYYATGPNEEHAKITAEKRDQILAELAQINLITPSPTSSPLLSPTTSPSAIPSVVPSRSPTGSPIQGITCPTPSPAQGVAELLLLQRLHTKLEVLGRGLRRCERALQG